MSVMFLLTTMLPLAEALKDVEQICSVLSAAASLINAFAAETHCRACNQTLHSVSAAEVLHELLCSADIGAVLCTLLGRLLYPLCAMLLDDGWCQCLITRRSYAFLDDEALQCCADM